MPYPKKRYRVNLAALQATCEANYHRLMRLMPTLGAAREFRLGDARSEWGVVRCRVLEQAPYTWVLQLTLEQPDLRWAPSPSMRVRVYHDAGMAEVIASQHYRHFHSRYAYPNRHMHQPDEKARVNAFLGEWLAHCLRHGRTPEPVY